MKKTFLFLITITFFCVIDVNSQNGFSFKNKKDKKQRVSFKLINNLIVIPLEINGKKLSFILDSGVSKTILFNISKNDSIGLKNVEKVDLRGLGRGKPVEALLSKNNKLSIQGITSDEETIYVIIKDKFDLSAKMGVTIHGILGYHLLKNFIVKINYSSKKITFYNPDKFNYKKCSKCETFPLRFYRRKPFLNAQIQLDTVGNTLTDVNLLIDSGGSDALWLFEGTKDNIKTPKRYFKDVLGEGLSGSIIGNRSRVSKFKLKSFVINSPTASFLDTISTRTARIYKDRNGSLGAAILKRFTVWFDYPNRKITLKKNAFFKRKFNYNMSGLDIVYSGKQLVKEKDVNKINTGFDQNVSSNNSINFITSFSYRFKSSYRIKSVLKNSPADKAGLLKDDIVLRINNKPSYDFNLGDITRKLQERDGKKIKLLIERDGKKMKFEFRLEKKV